MRAPIRWAEGLESLLVPIDSISQHPDNPNNGDVDWLIESIKVNGFNTVLTVDKDTGYIIAGNHRWQALHALGATHVPVIRAVDREGASGKRYMVADNVIGQMAVMDPSATLALLEDLRASEIGLAGSGINEDAFEKMLMEQALAAEAPLGDGEGGFGHAPSGIYQVVVEFEGDEGKAEQEDAAAFLRERYDRVRLVNL